MSELAKRTAFAVVAAPLGILAIYVGDAVLATILSLIAALGAWEFCRIAKAAGAEPFEEIAIGAAALVPLLVLGVHNRKLSISITHVALAILVVFASAIFFRGPNRRPLLSSATTIFGVAYVAMLAYVFDLRYHDYIVSAAGGTALAVLPLVLTWATDIGGYMFGRAFGEKKLFPSVSPGKTIAGAVGGMVLAVVVCWIYVKFVLQPVAQLSFTPLGIVLFAVALSVTALIGDLAESLIKREASVKDSSTIIPGHGGILDRFDSMLFVLPVAALLLQHLLIPAPV
jgi:phosphatidate cytidylyltransferase